MTAVSSLGHLKMRAAPANRPAGSDDTAMPAFPVAYWRELLSARWQAELARVT